jgi:hypothetical protein
MAIPSRVRIYEVGPRDGLQNEAQPISTDHKAQFIRLLVEAGLREIEVTSFVSPKAVPQLADAGELLGMLPGVLPRDVPVRLPVLVPNARGLERATAAGVDAIAVFTGASDAFTTRNIGMTIDESLAAFAPVVAAARARGWWTRGYVSTAFGCPYTGHVAPERVVAVSLALVELGIDEICLGGHHRGRRAAPGPCADRRARRRGDPRGATRVPLPRHARHGTRERGRGAGGRRQLLRRVDVRDRRVPVRAGCGRQPRDGGPGLPARLHGHRARRPARGRARGRVAS